MGGNLFVPSDLERSDSVSSLGGDGSLTGKLLEDLGGTGKSVTRFTDGDVFCKAWGCVVDEGRRSKGKGRPGSVKSRIDRKRIGHTDDELLDSELLHRVDSGSLLGLIDSQSVVLNSKNSLSQSLSHPIVSDCILISSSIFVAPFLARLNAPFPYLLVLQNFLSHSRSSIVMFSRRGMGRKKSGLGSNLTYHFGGSTVASVS